MTLRFRIFRQALCFLLSLLSGTALCTGIYLSRFFFRQGVVWLLVSVQLTNLIRSTWSGVRKSLFCTPQTVASEAIGLFVLFPFQLIIALILSSISARPNMPLIVFNILRISAVTGAVLHILYTAGIVATAMITVSAFDADVWMRDIDSSPSPFPMLVLFAYSFPWLARRFDSTRPMIQEPTPEDSFTVCLPTCPPDCSAHEQFRRASKNQQSNAEQGDTPCPAAVKLKRPPVLPHTLVRLPNAAERRSSIYVDLHITS